MVFDRLRPTANSAPTRTSGESFFRQPRTALFIGWGALSLACLLALLISRQPTGLDRVWAEEMRDSRNSARLGVALYFNALDHLWAVVITLGAAAFVLVWSRRWFALAAFASAEFASRLSAGLLKVIVARPRPPHELVAAGGYSFPSGHVSYFAATAISFVLLFARSGSRVTSWVVASLAIVGMAWSRTYLDVHWLSDVIGGALLAGGLTVLIFALAQSLNSNMSAMPREG
jgi:membrane-associated phospholipid phosphatase